MFVELISKKSDIKNQYLFTPINQLFKKWKLEDSNNKNSEFSKAFRQIKSKYGRHIFFHVVDRVLTLRKINAAIYDNNARIAQKMYTHNLNVATQQLDECKKMHGTHWKIKCTQYMNAHRHLRENYEHATNKRTTHIIEINFYNTLFNLLA